MYKYGTYGDGESSPRTGLTRSHHHSDADVYGTPPHRARAAVGRSGNGLNDASRLAVAPPGGDAMMVLQPPACAVYPELPADYYCVDCRCFVSSHAHVRGAHGSHTFLTIREAAEAHVPAMKAWVERCETQLHKAEAVLENVGGAVHALDSSLSIEDERIEAAYESIIAALRRQKETLRRQLRARVAKERAEASQAWRRVADLTEYFRAYLEHSHALLVNIPPVEAMSTAAVLWSADVMRTAELLNSAAQVDDVWLPELAVPRLGSHCSPETVSALLHLDLVPFTGADGRQLPTALDIRPFRYDGPKSHRTRASTAAAAAGGGGGGGSVDDDNRGGREVVGGRRDAAAEGGVLSTPRHVQRPRGRSSYHHDAPLQRGGGSSPSATTAADAAPDSDPYAVDTIRRSARKSVPVSAPPANLYLLPPAPEAEGADTVVLLNGGSTVTRRRPVFTPHGNKNAADSPVGEGVHVLLRANLRWGGPGAVGWSVRVDRQAERPTSPPSALSVVAGAARDDAEEAIGHLLTGVVQTSDPDGYGVVWDGDRILGPVTGQVFHVPAEARSRSTGAFDVRSFVLESVEDAAGTRTTAGLRATSVALLHCFLNDAFVTTLVLPPVPEWSPALSVLTPEDQASIYPVPASQLEALLMTARLNRPRRPSQGPGHAADMDDDGGREVPQRRQSTRLGGTPASQLGGASPRSRSAHSPELKGVLDYVDRSLVET